MIISDFKTNFHMYENMAIWEIANINDFFKAHEMLKEIFEKEYKFSYDSRIDKENDYTDSDIEMVNKLLDYFNDKHFLVFSNNDPTHILLKEFQDKKIINFGMDIYVLHPDKIYVMEMDKTKDVQKYDTL